MGKKIKRLEKIIRELENNKCTYEDFSEFLEWYQKKGIMSKLLASNPELINEFISNHISRQNNIYKGTSLATFST